MMSETPLPTQKKTKENTGKKGIILSDYNGTPESLQKLLNNGVFLTILKSHRVTVTKTNIYKGGFSVVTDCAENSVVKLSSLRKLTLTPENEYFKDISDDKKDDIALRECAKYKANLKRESYSYTLLDAERKKPLAEPFMIPVYKEDSDNIYDYILCIHLPRFTPLDEKMKSFKKTDALVMIRDVLECLDKAHDEGLRHRDIKAENIMYDDVSRKYVLIDWGTSSNNADDDYASEAYRRSGGAAYTNIYVDPERLTNPKKNTPPTDLYSLGILMVFLAHPHGYFRTKRISSFHASVCPEEIIEITTESGKSKQCCVLSSEVADSIRNTDYRNIAKKAMEYAYTSAGEMKNDVDKALGNSSAARKNSFSHQITISPILGIPIALFLCLFTIIFSGRGINQLFITAEDKTSAATIYLLLLCLLIPALATFIANGGRSLKFRIPVISATVLTCSFLAISLLSVAILKIADTRITLAVNCIAFIVSVVISLFANRILKCGMFSKFLVCSIIAGFFSGFNTAVCISAEISAKLFSLFFIKLILSATALGAVCGIWIWFIWFLWHTRIKER